MAMSASSFPSNLVEIPVTIALNGTVSSAAELNGLTLVGIAMPAAFTGTALTLQASYADGTYRDVTNTSGAAISYTVAASKFIAIDPAALRGINRLKLISGSTELAARTVTILAKPVQ